MAKTCRCSTTAAAAAAATADGNAPCREEAEPQSPSARNMLFRFWRKDNFEHTSKTGFGYLRRKRSAAIPRADSLAQ